MGIFLTEDTVFPRVDKPPFARTRLLPYDRRMEIWPSLRKPPRPETGTFVVDGRLSIDWVRRAGTKRLGLSVHQDGRIRVRAPLRCPEQAMRAFADAHVRWIDAARNRLERVMAIRLPPIAKEEVKQKRAEARQLVEAILRRILPTYGFTHKAIRIKQQKTRWGSCSSQGNLNFNLRIIQLPPELAEYLVVHELCHLQEMNHSARFWALVARTCPAYREMRRALRTGYRLL